jgi:hypothetical protein
MTPREILSWMRRQANRFLGYGLFFGPAILFVALYMFSLDKDGDEVRGGFLLWTGTAILIPLGAMLLPRARFRRSVGFYALGVVLTCAATALAALVCLTLGIWLIAFEAPDPRTNGAAAVGAALLIASAYFVLIAWLCLRVVRRVQSTSDPVSEASR